MNETVPSRTPTTRAFAAWVGFMIGYLACKILCASSDSLGPWG